MVQFDDKGQGTRPADKPPEPLPTTSGAPVEGQSIHERTPWWGSYEPHGMNSYLNPGPNSWGHGALSGWSGVR